MWAKVEFPSKAELEKKTLQYSFSIPDLVDVGLLSIGQQLWIIKRDYEIGISVSASKKLNFFNNGNHAEDGNVLRFIMKVVSLTDNQILFYDATRTLPWRFIWTDKNKQTNLQDLRVKLYKMKVSQFPIESVVTNKNLETTITLVRSDKEIDEKELIAIFAKMNVKVMNITYVNSYSRLNGASSSIGEIMLCGGGSTAVFIEESENLCGNV
eukprot:TRINITY_DN26811_c0_g1_i1.p1 TRINITY_DN26811_c0_g1~~TRINITY_DN26811_c0_g1_i1.p1  ORF type:complete len:211 (-),score=30.01 TRINITY_DN26811_c0_g1_i1:919-1551(-)